MIKKINLNCTIGNTGYGITSLNILKGLYQKNIDLSLFMIGNSAELNYPEEKAVIEELHNKKQLFDYNAPFLKIWHPNDLAYKIGKGHYYALTFFELDTLSMGERHHLNYVDYIFVASKWGKEVLLNNGIKKPIYVAPLGVDLSIFAEKNDIKIKDNYVFSHIGKWEKRKGQDFLIKCFENAFDINDNVELRLLPHNPFLNDQQLSEWLNLVNNSKLKDKIKIYKRLPTQYHLSEFIEQSDCCIFLSRAEGWNNEIPECMALNKPIIATNYSAHTEYCDSNNSFLVDIDELELAYDQKWFYGQGKWAKLGDKEMEQTVDLMRMVYNKNITTNPNGVQTAHKYSWNNTVSIIDETLTNNNSYANSTN